MNAKKSNGAMNPKTSNGAVNHTQGNRTVRPERRSETNGKNNGAVNHRKDNGATDSRRNPRIQTSSYKKNMSGAFNGYETNGYRYKEMVASNYRRNCNNDGQHPVQTPRYVPQQHATNGFRQKFTLQDFMPANSKTVKRVPDTSNSYTTPSYTKGSLEMDQHFFSENWKQEKSEITNAVAENGQCQFPLPPYKTPYLGYQYSQDLGFSGYQPCYTVIPHSDLGMPEPIDVGGTMYFPLTYVSPFSHVNYQNGIQQSSNEHPTCFPQMSTCCSHFPQHFYSAPYLFTSPFFLDNPVGMPYECIYPDTPNSARCHSSIATPIVVSNSATNASFIPNPRNCASSVAAPSVPPNAVSCDTSGATPSLLRNSAGYASSIATPIVPSNPLPCASYIDTQCVNQNPVPCATFIAPPVLLANPPTSAQSFPAPVKSSNPTTQASSIPEPMVPPTQTWASSIPAPPHVSES